MCIRDSPYAIWLSEIILQQTRIAQGWEYWERFMKTYPKVEDLAANYFLNPSNAKMSNDAAKLSLIHIWNLWPSDLAILTGTRM